MLLGRIPADRPLGGGLLAALDIDRAREAIERHVARPLGLDALRAAEAIITVADARMAGAVRVASIERGHDPRRFAYMPFGGGGALHVCAMMRAIGVSTGLVPRYPGVTSALGCVIADLRHDDVRTVSCALADVDFEALRSALDAMAARAAARLASAGVALTGERESIELDMLYTGQTHTVRVPLTRTALDPQGVADAFGQAYRRAFGRTLDGIPPRVINLRYARIGERPHFDLSVLGPAATQMPAPLGTRPVYHASRWWDATRFARLDLPVGARVQGPAILEQADTTVWLEPGFAAEVDPLGNLVIAVRPQESRA